jgi:hypothetical protein
MPTDAGVFRDLAYVLLAAGAGGAVARLARQPVIMGYVLGGILVSPFTPGPVVSELHTFELFAEIGVILLMFFIGAEFSPQELLRLKWVGLVGGTLGILALTGRAKDPVARDAPVPRRPVRRLRVSRPIRGLRSRNRRPSGTHCGRNGATETPPRNTLRSDRDAPPWLSAQACGRGMFLCRSWPERSDFPAPTFLLDAAAPSGVPV